MENWDAANQHGRRRPISGLSISNKGSRVDVVPSLPITRVTRRRRASATTVLASSLKAIWTDRLFAKRNGYGMTFSMRKLMQLVGGHPNGVTAFGGPLSMAAVPPRKFKQPTWRAASTSAARARVPGSGT